MLKHRTLIFSLTALILLSSCALSPNSEPTSIFFESTAIYETVSAQLTASAQPKTSLATALPSKIAGTDSPNLTPQPDFSAIPPTSSPCDRAAAGRPSIDISIPDGTPLTPGQSFTKTWRLVNAGSCIWTRDYAVVWFSGEPFGSAQTQALSSEVKPGQSVDINLDMVSPMTPGIYQSNWMMRNASGQFFGLGPTNSAPFWVKIEVIVVRSSTPSPIPSPTPTATMLAVSRGASKLGLDKKFDLDTGKMATDGSADVGLEAVGTDGLQLTAFNGAKFDPVGNLPPSITACKGAALKSEPILLGIEMAGMHLCYRTNQSLPGYLVIKSVNLKDKTVLIEYVTWAAP